MKSFKKLIIIQILLLSIIAFFNSANAQKVLTVEFYTGIPVNVPTPLKITQAGENDIDITAHYNSEPFKVPIY